MCGQWGASAHNEAHASSKGGFEGAEDVFVQQRCCLHQAAHSEKPSHSLIRLSLRQAKQTHLSTEN